MTNTERQQYWQQQIADWQASQLSGAAFCKQQAVSYHTFVYWRKRITQAASLKNTGTGFAKVTPVSDRRSGELVLSLPGGVSIAGLHAGNVELLGAILRQL